MLLPASPSVAGVLASLSLTVTGVAGVSACLVASVGASVLYAADVSSAGSVVFSSFTSAFVVGSVAALSSVTGVSTFTSSVLTSFFASLVEASAFSEVACTAVSLASACTVCVPKPNKLNPINTLAAPIVNLRIKKCY